MSALPALLALVLAVPAGAAVKKEDIIDPGALNEAYIDLVSGQRLQTRIPYLKPDTDFQPEETELQMVRPDPEPEVGREQTNVTMNRWTAGLMFGALLIGVIVLFVLYGGGISVSFASEPKDGKREDVADDAEEDKARAALMAQPIDSFLESLRRMTDRRAALILLVSRALERAAALNDLRLGRSQTARDVVRVLPRSWPHLGNMRRLVREAEIVHFGGRELPEEIWEECLDAARPIFGEGRPA